MVILYAVTMFTSATLLFIVQPMVAKLLLPGLGGSAAVWTTCMLFFQVMLLVGYGYSHLGARLLSPRQQAMVHVPLMLLAAVVLPFSVPDVGIDPSVQPTAWLLVVLVVAVGMPFFIVSTTAPLLQHFFGHVDHPDSGDPYFLYGASNLGSMVALIGYPLVVEPLLGVKAQTYSWAAVYGIFILMLIACARTIWTHKGAPLRSTSKDDAPSLTWRQRFRWIALAAVPSSVMLGVTHHITTDLAPVPLLWVVPLALYLATFVLVFARKPILLPEKARTLLPLLALLLFAVVNEVGGGVAVALHILNFFLFTLFFHGTLARERPHVARLTEYFLLLSIGGAAGGLFNALIAPVVFDQLIEYYLVLFGSVIFIGVDDWRLGEPVNRWFIPVIAAALSGVYLWTCKIITPDEWYMLPVYGAIVVIVGVYKPKWQNVVLGCVLAAGGYMHFAAEGLMYDRSFFAAYKVYETEREGERYRYFSHGNTLHGSQALDPEEAKIPRSYYHPEGPVGEVMDTIQPKSVLVIGLGAGAVAAWGGEHRTFEFYEIDPLVHEIADEWFTYLSTCGEHCSVAVGDGRRLLAESDKKFDMILLDAYNSDGIPTHLVTREVFQLYLEHLTPRGVLLFHVSNRYLDVPKVVGTLLADANIPAYDRAFVPEDKKRAKANFIVASRFIIAAPDPTVLKSFAAQPDVWRKPPVSDTVWTDDFTDLLSVIRW